jgi:hypothetical protein
MSESPIDLDKHRGMAERKATDIRRALAEVEANAKLLRDKQGVVEIQILAAPATSWPEAVAKASYVLNLYSAGLAPTDTHHRDLVAAVLADLTDSWGKTPEPTDVRAQQVNAQSGSFQARSNGPTEST